MKHFNLNFDQIFFWCINNVDMSLGTNNKHDKNGTGKQLSER